jgi:hypothetical protein
MKIYFTIIPQFTLYEDAEIIVTNHSGYEKNLI